MVIQMDKYSFELSRVFLALGDPTRRALLMRLGGGEASVSELAQPLAMALPSVLKHLRVLEQAGLVRTRKRGRTRYCMMEPEPLLTATEWLSVELGLPDGQ